MVWVAFLSRCAGICQYERGGGCRIKLSEPLLKVKPGSCSCCTPTQCPRSWSVHLQFRPALELKETLLHEMIHAWIFLEKIRDQGDHGPRFQTRMNFINSATFADHQVQFTFASCCYWLNSKGSLG